MIDEAAKLITDFSARGSRWVPMRVLVQRSTGVLYVTWRRAEDDGKRTRVELGVVVASGSASARVSVDGLGYSDIAVARQVLDFAGEVVALAEQIEALR